MAIDPNIKKKANDIRNKVYGREVRESLASGLEAMSSDVVETVGRQDEVEGQFQDVLDETTNKDFNSAPEIRAARDGEANLKARLDKEHQKVTAQLAQIVRVVPIDIDNVAESINNFYTVLPEETTMKVPAGHYDLYQPLVLNKKIDLDFTGVTFEYFGEGVAVTVGNEDEGIHSRNYVLPNIINNELNWSINKTGLRLINLYSSMIYLGDVSFFKTGVIVEGLNSGNSYNEYHFKRVVNNLHSLVVTSNDKGWANQNMFISGRFALTSDVRDKVSSNNTHILIEHNGYSQNNLIFSGVSFESATEKNKEFVAKIEDGRMIYFRNCRYESIHNVEITNGVDIQFTNGFDSALLNFTAKEPNVHETNHFKKESKTKAFEYLTTQTSSNPIANYYSTNKNFPRFTVEGDGSLISTGEKIYTTGRFEWGGGASQLNNKSFSNGSKYPEGNINAVQGSLYVRNPFGQLFIKSSGLNNANGWRLLQTITSSATDSRPSNESLVVGYQHFDISLNKPIWWNGTKWVDSTGATV